MKLRRRLCKHQWIEADRYFYPPPRFESLSTTVSEPTLLAMTYGLTTVECRCHKCGAPSFTTTTGRAT